MHKFIKLFFVQLNFWLIRHIPFWFLIGRSIKNQSLLIICPQKTDFNILHMICKRRNWKRQSSRPYPFLSFWNWPSPWWCPGLLSFLQLPLFWFLPLSVCSRYRPPSRSLAPQFFFFINSPPLCLQIAAAPLNAGEYELTLVQGINLSSLFFFWSTKRCLSSFECSSNKTRSTHSFWWPSSWLNRHYLVFNTPNSFFLSLFLSLIFSSILSKGTAICQCFHTQMWVSQYLMGASIARDTSQTERSSQETVHKVHEACVPIKICVTRAESRERRCMARYRVSYISLGIVIVGSGRFRAQSAFQQRGRGEIDDGTSLANALA